MAKMTLPNHGPKTGIDAMPPGPATEQPNAKRLEKVIELQIKCMPVVKLNMSVCLNRVFNSLTKARTKTALNIAFAAKARLSKGRIRKTPSQRRMLSWHMKNTGMHQNHVWS